MYAGGFRDVWWQRRQGEHEMLYFENFDGVVEGTNGINQGNKWLN